MAPYQKMILLFFLATILLGADRFMQTTADPDTKILKVRLNNNWLEINLETPGAQIKKYNNGTLKEVFVPMVNNWCQIHFYPQKPRQTERIALIKRYELVHDVMQLNGKTESYDENGFPLCEANWEEGKPHGMHRIFDDAGQLIEEREYQRGFPINIWKWWYPNGKIAIEIHFPESIKEWRESRIEGKTQVASNLIDMPYEHPIYAKEVWYGFDGKKQKERMVMMVEHNLSFTVHPTGEEFNYNAVGDVFHKFSTSVKAEAASIGGHLYAAGHNSWANNTALKNTANIDYIYNS